MNPSVTTIAEWLSAKDNNWLSLSGKSLFHSNDDPDFHKTQQA